MKQFMKGLINKIFEISIGLITWLILFLIFFWGQSYILGTILDINNIVFTFSKITFLERFGILQEKISLNQILFGTSTLIIMIKFINIPQLQKKNKKGE